MKIVFDKRPGQFLDLIRSLYYIYNKDYKESHESYNITINKNAEDSIAYLSGSIKINEEEMGLFLSKDVLAANIFTESLDLWPCQTMDHFIELLKKLDENEIRYRLLKQLNYDDCEEEKLRGILSNNEALMSFIKELKIKSALKWDICYFFKDTKSYLDKFFKLLEEYSKIYFDVLKNNEGFIDEFCEYMEKNINETGKEFLKRITGTFYEYESIDDFEEIYISPMFFSASTLLCQERNGKLYIHYGIDFEKVAKQVSGEGELEKNLNIFKYLLDKTRFQIVRLLVSESLYGQEITEKVGLSMATISHHMSFLISSNLVKVERKGHKIYYAFNKKTLTDSIEFLKRTFKL